MKDFVEEEMAFSSLEDGEAFWVLREPGTDNTVMARQDGDHDGPVTFPTEELAIQFANLYDIPHKMVPTYVTVKHGEIQ
jgi:hypothetical protein